MTSEDRIWECPDCENEEDRHHSTLTRPFCDECEFRWGVLIEMVPKGPGSEKFYDDDGNAIDPEYATDGGVLETRDTCDCGRQTMRHAHWCSAGCYQSAAEDSDFDLPCLNDHWWCPGPDGPTVSGEAWGGKCSDCYIEGGGDGN